MFQMIPNYYKRIEPPDCYVLSKSFATAEAEESKNAASGESA